MKETVVRVFSQLAMLGVKVYLFKDSSGPLILLQYYIKTGHLGAMLIT